MSKAKVLRTGDIKRFTRNPYVYCDDKWGVITIGGEFIAAGKTRYYARIDRDPGERIAKILNITPKTVLIEVSK